MYLVWNAVVLGFPAAGGRARQERAESSRVESSRVEPSQAKPSHRRRLCSFIFLVCLFVFLCVRAGGLPTDPVARLIASSQSSPGGGGSLISTAAASFSLAAVTTSFIGFVLGLSDFFADWMKMPADQVGVEAIA